MRSPSGLDGGGEASEPHGTAHERDVGTELSELKAGVKLIGFEKFCGMDLVIFSGQHSSQALKWVAQRACEPVSGERASVRAL